MKDESLQEQGNENGQASTEEDSSTAIGQDSALPAVSVRQYLGHGAIRLLFMDSEQLNSWFFRICGRRVQHQKHSIFSHFPLLVYTKPPAA